MTSKWSHTIRQSEPRSSIWGVFWIPKCNKNTIKWTSRFACLPKGLRHRFYIDLGDQIGFRNHYLLCKCVKKHIREIHVCLGCFFNGFRHQMSPECYPKITSKRSSFAGKPEKEELRFDCAGASESRVGPSRKPQRMPKKQPLNQHA